MQLLLLFVSGVAGVVLQTCNDRYGSVPEDTFNHRSGAMCYAYLFQSQKPLLPVGDQMDSLVPNPHLETHEYDEISSALHPDIRNQTTTDMICTTLSEVECEQWKSCCHAALNCCRRQLDTLTAVPDGYCSRQWDGWTCWEDTPPDTDAYGTCPGFVKGFLPEGKYLLQTNN